MSLEILAFPVVFLVTVTSAGILVVQSWRLAIILLVIQYVGVFVLSALSWPIQLALAKVIAGWITAAVLWMAQSGIQTSLEEAGNQVINMTDLVARPHYSGWIFRIFAAGIVGMVILAIAPAVDDRLPQLGDAQILGSLLLIGIGLLHLGLTSNPFWVVLGLITVLTGFEIIYAGVEISALVQGLLAGVTLGLGIIGAYLILSPTMEPAE